MCLQSAELRYRIRGDRRSPRTVQQIAKTTASHLHEKIMQTLGGGDGFFSLPAVRGPDARERFRTSQAVKYESLHHQLWYFSSIKNFSQTYYRGACCSWWRWKGQYINANLLSWIVTHQWTLFKSNHYCLHSSFKGIGSQCRKWWRPNIIYPSYGWNSRINSHSLILGAKTFQI